MALQVSSGHCCTKSRVFLADSQGGVTNHRSCLHKARAGTNTQERGVAPHQGRAHGQGCVRKLDTAWPVDIWSTSVSCAVNPSQHELKYSPKIPGSNPALSCLPVALIKLNKTITQPKRVQPSQCIKQQGHLSRRGPSCSKSLRHLKFVSNLTQISFSFEILKSAF